MISLYYSTNLDKIIRTEFVASSKVKIFQKNCVKKLVNDKCWISKRIDNALLIYGGPKFSVAHLLKWLVLGLEKAPKNLVWLSFFCIFGSIGDMTWNYKLVVLLVRLGKENVSGTFQNNAHCKYSQCKNLLFTCVLVSTVISLCLFLL